MTAPLSRRHFMAALPVAALAVSCTPVAAETPIMAVFREWQAAKAIEDAAYGSAADETECDRAWEARWRIEQRLMAMECTTAQDWLIKLAAWTNFGSGTSPDRVDQPTLWDEARALIGA